MSCTARISTAPRRPLGTLALWAALTACLPALALAQNLSPGDQQRALETFQSLSPGERSQALEALRSGETPSLPGSDQPDVSTPQVVRPLPQQGSGQANGSTNGENGSLTSIERQMNKATGQAALDVEPVPRSVTQTLRQFGYDLFAGAPTTFAPVTEIPVPAEYVIGPGDALEVQLYGKTNDQFTLTVNREGMISFPELGPIGVAGRTFDAVRADLKRRVDQQMIGVRISVSIGELRSMRVFVLGDVRRPGSYTVSSLSTMTNALFVSGGVRPVGTLRDIQLKRRGQVVARLDLYDLLLQGDTSGDRRLLPGDVIFVPPIGATVGVAGEVRRPAIYELAGPASAADALQTAGGLLSSAYARAAQLERVGPSGGRDIRDLDLTTPQARSVGLRDGDVLRVYSVTERMDNLVLLRGHVQRPGGYEWTEGMRISDLVDTADDLLPNPDLDYLLVRRELPPGRRIQALSVNLERALANPGGPADLPLHSRDTVYVFSLLSEAEAEAASTEEEPDTRGIDRAAVIEPIIRQLRAQARRGEPEQVVSIRGRVSFPGEYPLEPGMAVPDLVRAAGGLSQEAYTLDAELTRYRITNEGREIGRERVALAPALDGTPAAAVALRPFDVLQIKAVPDWAENQTIQIAGEVQFPGIYSIRPGETLADVLERAGGLTTYAYPEGAFFSREELREKEQQELDRLAERLRSDLAALSLEQIAQDQGTAQAAQAARSLLSDLETSQAVGRLVIDLPMILAGTADVDLRDGDRLFVPKVPQSVSVLGEVQQTTSHLYRPDLSRDDYIRQSGGMTVKADDDRIYIVRASGAVVASTPSLWFGSERHAIHRGDTIVVPLDVTRMRPLTLWSSIADIASKLALTLASANAVGVF